MIFYNIPTKSHISRNGTHIVIRELIINKKKRKIMLVFKNDPFFKMVDNFFDIAEENETHGQVMWNQTYDDNQHLVEFIVPGLSKSDISIVVEENQLKISHEKTEETSKYVNSFGRVFDLPENVDDKKITAKVEDGVLRVLLPKTKKKKSQRTISVN
jgi:HSP20 family protein